MEGLIKTFLSLLKSILSILVEELSAIEGIVIAERNAKKLEKANAKAEKEKEEKKPRL